MEADPYTSILSIVKLNNTDTNNLYLEIILLIVLVLLSAFFSASETALSTCNHIKIKNLANRGNKKAELALKLLDNYDKLITTILIGNNFVNIATASISTLIFVRYFTNGATLSTLVTTIVVLIFGEITPKSLANRFADRFAITISPIINFLEIILFPLTWLFGLIKKIFDSKVKEDEDDSFTNDELITIIDEVENQGNMEADESELVKSAIEFNDLDVRDILTPRIEVIAIEKNDSVDKIKEIFEKNQYSRLPVYEKDIDHIIGFIHEKDFFATYTDEKFNINKIMRDIVPVPLNSSMLDTLKLLQKKKTHLAVVFDEFGGTQGIVTMEDILEELVGEIWDEHDMEEFDLNQVNQNTWDFSGTCSLADMFDVFPNYEENADSFDSDTVGGFVCELLERMPRKGETLDYRDLKITVLDCNDRICKKIRITKK